MKKGWSGRLPLITMPSAMLPTILITSAIAPPPNTPMLRMTDSNMRSITTRAAVFFWIGQGQKNIVICDATESSVLSAEELATIRKLGVFIEQLAYKQDDLLLAQRGKGFAEGQLIKFAVENSQLLGRSDSFFKCTGKVFCRNFAAIWDLIARNNIANMYWKLTEGSPVERNLVDARFFYTSSSDFHRLLLPAYEQSTETRILEYNLLLSLDGQLQRGTSLRPQLSGFAGGTGNQYPESYLGDLELSYPCWYSLKTAQQAVVSGPGSPAGA
jgi:hypothetical protein